MDFKELEERLKRLNEKEMMKIQTRIVRQLGTVLLRMIRNEVKAQGLIESREVMKSFTRGQRGNAWYFDKDRNSVSLEVGSNYYVARLLEQGYTIHEPHFVPGRVEGGRFIYDPDATVTVNGKERKTGVVMKPREFIGRKFLDATLDDFNGGVKGLIEKLLKKEIEKVLK